MREWTGYMETGRKGPGKGEAGWEKGEEGERREKRTPACPFHLHCIQTLHARFGRSVLKTRS